MIDNGFTNLGVLTDDAVSMRSVDCGYRSEQLRVLRSSWRARSVYRSTIEPDPRSGFKERQVQTCDGGIGELGPQNDHQQAKRSYHLAIQLSHSWGIDSVHAARWKSCGSRYSRNQADLGFWLQFKGQMHTNTSG